LRAHLTALLLDGPYEGKEGMLRRAATHAGLTPDEARSAAKAAFEQRTRAAPTPALR